MLLMEEESLYEELRKIESRLCEIECYEEVE